MAQLQTKVPPRPGSAAGEILELARGLDRPAVDVSAVRKRLEAKVREEHQRLDDYSASVNVVVADIIGLMRAGQTVKVDELIQSFRRDELETVRSKQEFESDAAKVLRAVAKRVPEGLRLANDALAEALRISDRIAAFTMMRVGGSWKRARIFTLAPAKGRFMDRRPTSMST